MKIGIITHHYVKNYGAFLQMKALYEMLKLLYPNAEIKIINYVNRKHWYKNILHVLHFRRGIDTIKSYTQKIRQLIIFSKYEHKIPRTKKVRTVKDILKLNLDIIVFGSDEIWNFGASGYSPIKFGYGLEEYRGKLIAYAPSVGLPKINNPNVQNRLRECIERFPYLSTREKSGSLLINKLIGRDVESVLDPTFLISCDEWLQFASNLGRNYGPYLLVYMLGRNESHWKSIYKIAKELNLNVKVIPVFTRDLKREGCIKDIVGPEEFLSLVYNSSYITFLIN